MSTKRRASRRKQAPDHKASAAVDHRAYEEKWGEKLDGTKVNPNTGS